MDSNENKIQQDYKTIGTLRLRVVLNLYTQIIREKPNFMKIFPRPKLVSHSSRLLLFIPINRIIIEHDNFCLIC
jgi:hypothetical protein